MRDKIRLLKFWSNGDKTVDGRRLVGHVQGSGNLGDVSEYIYDCFDSVKPTYYYNAKGESVDYITHAQFIAENSFRDYDDGGMWVYPMLTFEDRDTYNAVILKITYYERKPYITPPLEAKKD